MNFRIVAFLVLLCSAPFASAQLSINIGGVTIGFNQPTYPDFQQVPDSPVYYSPRSNANYFFYDGMYWLYRNDNWYASSWYNGPWDQFSYDNVPPYLLRVPVSYYRQPPSYFRGWQRNEPPRWGQHWGRDWEQRHSDWDRWDRRNTPAPAPLPRYQRAYSGNRYPTGEQQHALHDRNYRYQPKEQEVRQHYEQRRAQAPAAAPAERTKQVERPNRDEHTKQAEPQRNPRQETSRRPETPAPAQERNAPRPQSAERPKQPQEAARGATHPEAAKGEAKVVAPHNKPAAKAEPNKGHQNERENEKEHGK